MSDQRRAYPFAIEEYRQRLGAIRERMATAGVAALIVDEKEHLGYLTGFSPSASLYQACIVPLNAEPVMVLRRLDEPTFRERSWLRDYRLFSDWSDPFAAIAMVVAELGLDAGRIGLEFDSHYLTLRRFQAHQAALPRATFVDLSPALRELRLRKSAAEIGYLSQAASIADQAMKRAIEALGAGQSERIVAIEASRAFIELGADSPYVGPIVSGRRTDSLHGALGDQLLEPGDRVHIELVPTVAGYSARLMRQVVIGEASAELAEIARRLLEIQDEQFAAIRPGVLGAEVDRIARQQVLDAGLRERYDNATGYTLGFYGSPFPSRSSDFTRVLLPNADWTFEAGMVFHMYLTARGVAFSETVLVTEDGHQRLTMFPRELFTR